MAVANLVAEAENAVASGDLQRAVTLLLRAAELQPDDATLWMKVAAMHRGTGNLRAALDTVHRALALLPLDFTALLMRASLLQRLGDPEAGEAWGNALAQKPDAELPSQLTSVVAQAEEFHAAWLNRREAQMEQHMASAEARADPEERARIERFRSNALRRTKPYHSNPTHYQFPALPRAGIPPAQAISLARRG